MSKNSYSYEEKPKASSRLELWDMLSILVLFNNSLYWRIFYCDLSGSKFCHKPLSSLWPICSSYCYDHSHSTWTYMDVYLCARYDGDSNPFTHFHPGAYSDCFFTCTSNKNTYSNSYTESTLLCNSYLYWQHDHSSRIGLQLAGRRWDHCRCK